VISLQGRNSRKSQGGVGGVYGNGGGAGSGRRYSGESSGDNIIGDCVERGFLSIFRLISRINAVTTKLAMVR